MAKERTDGRAGVEREGAAGAVGDCVVGNLRRTVRVVDRVYADAMAGQGIGRVQFSLLGVIAAQGGIEVGALCQRMAIERSALFRQLRPLQANGWVLRERAQGDGRRVVLRLSQSGQVALTALDQRWRAAQSRVLASFGEDRWRSLLCELEALQRAVDE